MKRIYPFRIFLAGCDIEPMHLVLQETQARNFLYTYYAMTPQQLEGIEKAKARYPEVSFFLDSGAYSAYQLGGEIDLKTYTSFCKDTQKLWDIITGLDIIGDMTGEQTWANIQYMESQGLKPMITYHMGEPFSVLDRIAEHHEFYALGGLASSELGQSAQDRWLDEVWRRYPTKKVHGFGFFRYAALVRYPWASVDSTAWLNARRYGMIILPDGKGLMRAEHMGMDPDLPFSNTLTSVNNLLELERRVNAAVEGSPIVEETLPGF